MSSKTGSIPQLLALIMSRVSLSFLPTPFVVFGMHRNSLGPCSRQNGSSVVSRTTVSTAVLFVSNTSVSTAMLFPSTMFIPGITTLH